MTTKHPKTWPLLDDLAKKLEANPEWEAAADSLADWMKPEIERVNAALSEAKALFSNVYDAYESDAIAYIKANPPSPHAICALIFVAQKGRYSENGKKAADHRHDLPGGSRDKQKAMRDAWASGKYTSRDICAEQECGALDMSLSAARKALRNTPKPA